MIIGFSDELGNFSAFGWCEDGLPGRAVDPNANIYHVTTENPNSDDPLQLAGQTLLLVMTGSDDGSDEQAITNNHVGYEGLTDAEADKVSYWADWVELNAVAPSEPPKPPPNFNSGYSSISNRCEEDNGRVKKAKL
ncbi:hypothetical protein INT44_001959 [Umbelopsis vinacea]|uniref:Uncharacterized protein n=1 Tax=Umbelopsis vinacea TaxID=44442 RepID=A0A8H7UND6_9FUNG|nr:hypothetical protein INT44_001959 [Umbelopsis vinacea]